MKFCSVMAALALLGASLLPLAIYATTRPKVDLSLVVTKFPVVFVPGGRSTITLTVHNDGPDTAGATSPGFSTITVIEEGFSIIGGTPPLPFVIRDPVNGCGANEYITEPLLDGDVEVVFYFDFDPIPAGESRRCSYDVEFLQTTVHSFPTEFLVHASNDDDVNHANDRAYVVFGAAEASIPAMSPAGVVVTTAGILGLVWRRRRKRVE